MYKSFFVVLIAVILTGCRSEQSVSNIPTVHVEAATVSQHDVPHYIETIGNVYAYSIVQIRPQVQGILLKANVQQGSYVEAGDLLYEIDPRTYQASLDQAKANLARDQATLQLAENTVKRYEEVAKKEFISELTFDQYKTNLKTAQAQIQADQAAIEQAQINLDYTKIYSPIAGKVSIYNIYPGNLVVVNDSTALTEIRQISPAEIRFTVPQKDLQELQRYQSLEHLPFQVSLPYEDNRLFEGTINFIDNHIDLQSGTILIKGIIPNEDRQLWPGEFVRVRIFTYIQKNALIIPFSAIQTGQQGQYVYKINPDMSVQTVYVTTGQHYDNFVVINSGLELGDQVVTNGQVNLRAGAKVSIAASTDSKAAS